MNFVPQLRKLRYPSEIKTFSLRILRFALSDLELDNHCPAPLVKCYSCPPPFIVIISYLLAVLVSRVLCCEIITLQQETTESQFAC